MMSVRIVNVNPRIRSSMPARMGIINYQKIRDNIFPRDLFLIEHLRPALGKKYPAQPPFAKHTGFPVIMTVPAMSSRQPEFKKKDEKYITDDQNRAEPGKDICTNTVDQE
jgi:hypothetical protein